MAGDIGKRAGAGMIRSVTKLMGSLLNLLGIFVRELAQVTAALLKRDWHVAGEHARSLYLSTHEDVLNAVVALQRRLPLWREPRRDIDRILIVKLDRIGDMVTTTPVLDALRELYPK